MLGHFVSFEKPASFSARLCSVTPHSSIPSLKPTRQLLVLHGNIHVAGSQWGTSTQRVCPTKAANSSQTGEASTSPASFSKLADLDFMPVVNLQGYILPNVPSGTEAVVFAIYDQSKTLQYVGFSKDLRSTLRTVFGRRPDKSHFYRAIYLPAMDQQAMMDIRSSWFEQNSGPPPGNRLPAERAAWQAPLQALALSDRGKNAAAEELAKQQLVKIRSRGCKEDFLPNPEMLAQGEVDFLAADALSPEEVERQRALAEAANRATRQCSAVVDGETVPFDLFFAATIKCNGGYMFDVRVTYQDRESVHRIIVGKDYYEAQGLDPEEVVIRVFAFLLGKKVPRHTEGMLLSNEFPVNYFSVSELHQFFADFEEHFEDGWLDGTAKFWRFNRTEDYGYKGANEDPRALAEQFRLV